MRLVNYFDAVLAQRAQIRCDVEFQTGGCHYADEPIYVGPGLPFARGKRELCADTLQAIFALAGESPNDQQQLAYHLWTQSTPGRLGQEELKRAFSALLAEVSRRGELILESATPAQRRVLFATAIREDEETSTGSFIRFAGFKNNSSVGAALRPFLKGNNAILEKRAVGCATASVSCDCGYYCRWSIFQACFPPAAPSSPVASRACCCRICQMT